jgi:hypothetical protein
LNTRESREERDTCPGAGNMDHFISFKS